MRFMEGRNGNDDLNRLLSIITLIILVIGMISRISVFLYIGIGLMAIQIFRMMSRNLDKREEENFRYLDFKDGIFDKFDTMKNRRQDKTHVYFKCPKCKKTLRVPVGKGKISIHCPKCGADFIKKT